MNILNSVTENEKAKYEHIWQRQSYRSKSALWFLDNVAGELTSWKCLDIGCGDGYVVENLIKQGVDAYGCDITLAGIRLPTDRYQQCPAWKMPYKDEEFDLTFSTDVLEHIPEMIIQQVVKEIGRITKTITVHIIATFPEHKYFGKEVHLTVKPIEWWAERFKGLNITLIERTLKGWKQWQ